MPEGSENSPTTGQEGEGPSKKELKRRQKQAEKEAKKAEIAARLASERQAREDADSQNDFSKGKYGSLPINQGQEQSKSKWDKIEEINGSRAGQKVQLCCRLHTLRPTSAKLCFCVLRSEFGTVQAVIAQNENTISKSMVKFVASTNPESLVRLTATVSKPDVPIESCTVKDAELKIETWFIVSNAPSRLPFQLEDAMRPHVEDEEQKASEDASDKDGATQGPNVNLDTRLNNRVFELRTPTNHALFRLCSGVCRLFRDYLLDRDFVEIHSPKLIAAASEGGANVFKVQYFKGSAYLAQSPQLYKQMMIISGFPRVFEVGPVFRAENSNTHRHLTEFTGLDLEMAFNDHYHEVLDFILEMFVNIFQGLEKNYSKELAEVRRVWKVKEFQIFPNGKQEVLRMDYKDAIRILNENGVDLNETDDIDTTNERFLGTLIKKSHGCDFYVVDKFPLAVRPFYTMPSHADPKKWSNSYDIFMRGEEIMSGAQRVHDHDLLVSRATELGVELDGLRDYIDSFKLAASPHAGGGIGLERVLMLYLGTGNIRRTSLFPRDPQRLRP